MVRDRSTNKIVRSIESILRVLIEVQKADPNFKLNDAQKSEISLFQTLLKIAKQDKKAGWYDVPITKFAPVFDLMSELEEVLELGVPHHLAEEKVRVREGRQLT